MDPVRTVEVDGRTRNVFKCLCGADIFFIKRGQQFIKFLAPQENNGEVSLHDCGIIRKFDKTCFDCGQAIKIYKDGNKWVKENADGSPHNCKDLASLPKERVPEDKDSTNGYEYGGGY